MLLEILIVALIIASVAAVQASEYRSRDLVLPGQNPPRRTALILVGGFVILLALTLFLSLNMDYRIFWKTGNAVAPVKN